MAEHAHLPDLDLLHLVGTMTAGLRPWDAAGVIELVNRYREISRLVADPGARRVATERLHQIRDEDYVPSSDDRYVNGELYRAASAYLVAVADRDHGTTGGTIGREPPDAWPWEARFWKPKSTMRDLERAGALVAAELSRRLRVRDAFAALVVEACVAGGADRDYAAGEVAQVLPDHLKEEGIEVGDPAYSWGVEGAVALADELVLQHLERGRS